MSQVYILDVFVIFELLENIEKRVFWLVMHVYCCCTLEGTFNVGVMQPVDLLSIVRLSDAVNRMRLQLHLDD